VHVNDRSPDQLVARSAVAVLRLQLADPPQSVWFCSRCPLILGAAMSELLDRAVYYHLGVDHELRIRPGITSDEGTYGPASEWVLDG
jgi:hypothetical protein